MIIHVMLIGGLGYVYVDKIALWGCSSSRFFWSSSYL